jgi:arylsulfatase A-like enzyme
MLSSTFPKDNGIVRQVGIPVPCNFTMLAEALQAAGYATHAVVANGAVGSEFGFAQGFDSFIETWKNPPAVAGADPTGAENVTRLAAGIAERLAGSQPWFLWVHYLDPHFPYVPPAAARDRFQGDAHFDGTRRIAISGKRKQEMSGIGRSQVLDGEDRLAFYVARYDAEIAYVDGQIGVLLGVLGGRGLLADTLTAFTSDHGESLGEHEYYFNHGRFGFQSCLHVPLILHWPERLRPAVDRAPVELLHLAPTLLEAAGVELPGGRWAQGTSLWPRLREPEAAHSEMSFSEAGTATGREWIKVVRDRRFVLHHAPRITEQRWIGGAGEKWVLFDLASDPGETENVADRYPEEVERLKGAFAAWWRSPRFECATDGRPCEDSAAVADETTRQLRALGYL